MANREKLIVALAVLFAGLMLSGCGNPRVEFWQAVRKKDFVKAQSLLAKNEDLVNARDHRGWTLLHEVACSYYSVSAAELLVSKGADVNAKDKQLRTPLHLAAERHNAQMVEFLIANGANVTAGTGSGWTPLDLAVQTNPRMTNVIWMSDTFEALIEKIAEVTHGTHRETYFLDRALAVAWGNKVAVDVLIKKVTDVYDKSQSGADVLNKLLNRAIRRGAKDTVELLIDKGADVNARDPKGRTPLDYAHKLGHKEIAELLRKHGAVE